jgi:zinc protease
MEQYLQHCYAPENMVVVMAGQVDPDRAVGIVERYCGHWTRQGAVIERQPPVFQCGSVEHALERFRQRALVWAFPSAAAASVDRETAEAVAAILGGVNSRFYWNIVQKGLCHRAGAFYEDYADFGLMVMYALCEPGRSKSTLQAVQNEAVTLVREGPRPEELQRVKNLRRTGLASESEAPFYRLGQLVDDIEYHGCPRCPEDRLAEVDAVDATGMADYLSRFPITGEKMLVSAGPQDGKND